MLESSAGLSWNQRIYNQLLVITSQLVKLNDQTGEIVGLLSSPTPTPAARLVITLESATAMKQKGEIEMAKAKSFGKFKINILDNGTAQATVAVVDAAGLATTLEAGTPPAVWVSSDPGVVITPAGDGLSAVISPATPPVLVSGASFTVTATQPTLGPVSGSYSPVNVVAGPAGTFVITVQ